MSPPNCRPAATRQGLSPARRRLLALLQDLNYGRVEGLVVRDGDPVLAPPPRVVRTVKFGADNGPRPERDAADFRLKATVIDLFAEFDRLGSGVVERLEVKGGLPFAMEVAGPAA